MKHDVNFTLPMRALGKADIEFQVWGDGTKLGTLRVSKGALVWFPKDHKKGHKISWGSFDTLMRDYPTAETR